MVDKERVIEGREEKVLGSMSFLRLEASKMKQNTILLYSPVRVFTKICIITTFKRVRLTARRRKDSHKCEKIVAGIVRRQPGKAYVGNEIKFRLIFFFQAPIQVLDTLLKSLLQQTSRIYRHGQRTALTTTRQNAMVGSQQEPLDFFTAFHIYLLFSVHQSKAYITQILSIL